MENIEELCPLTACGAEGGNQEQTENAAAAGIQENAAAEDAEALEEAVFQERRVRLQICSREPW